MLVDNKFYADSLHSPVTTYIAVPNTIAEL